MSVIIFWHRSIFYFTCTKHPWHPTWHLIIVPNMNKISQGKSALLKGCQNEMGNVNNYILTHSQNLVHVHHATYSLYKILIQSVEGSLHYVKIIQNTSIINIFWHITKMYLTYVYSPNYNYSLYQI